MSRARPRALLRGASPKGMWPCIPPRASMAWAPRLTPQGGCPVARAGAAMAARESRLSAGQPLACHREAARLEELHTSARARATRT